MKAHILILNYNGADLLEQFLPAFVEAVRRSKHECRVSVIDNVSVDNSREVVARFGAKVGWLPMKENKILFSYNDVAATLDDDVLILMNNDVEPDLDFVDPLVDPFKTDKELFLVSPGFYSMDRVTVRGARAGGGMLFGLFWSKSVEGPAQPRPVSTLSGGMGAIDRMKFMALDGYDPLFFPGTLEDVDLSFRAWRRGWRSLYVPASRVYHLGQVSFKKRFGEKGIRVMNARNLYLFMWKNLRDKGYLAEHFFFMFPRMAWALVRGHDELTLGFVKALPKLSEAMRSRKKEKLPWVLSDREIFHRCSSKEA